jgi:tripartite-type tricarboxylate transporter receptor subunit TctC
VDCNAAAANLPPYRNGGDGSIRGVAKGMSMSAILRRAAAIAFGLCALAPAIAAAQYPSRPVQFVVPYAPGGSGDVLARLLSDRLAAKWGNQLVIENRAGAGGLVGTEYSAHANPDGYTIYLATDGPTTVAATLYKSVPYDWKRDFAPISLIALGYQVLVVSPKFPAKTLPEFTSVVKKDPDKYNIASLGIGSPPHLAAELFQAQAGIKMTHVPFRGSSVQAITALMSGDVSAYIVGVSTALPFVQSGTLRALAVASPRRLENLPDVPTFAESGLPDFDYSLWFAVLAPSQTPPAIITKLHDDIAAAVADPAYNKALVASGYEPKSDTPEELATFLAKDYVKNRALIQKLGLQEN